MRFRVLSALALSAASLSLAAPLAGQGTGSGAAQPAAQADPNEDSDARFRRIQAEAAARAEAQQRARRQWEDDVRESADARARYEAGLREHQAEVARLEAERADYERRRAESDRQRAEYDRQMAERESGSRSDRRREERRTAATPAPAADGPAVASARCDEQMRRNRNRGRGIGSLIGTGAGLLGNRIGAPAGLLAAALPVGAILGDAIARRLNRCEQEQAAVATEEATRGGVGTTATWTSETRPDVTGSSVVTAAETGADGECLTVTDIIIVDGEETRAPKRMCRRPPSTRFVRV